jgi:DNA-binding NtrC family response regulator/tetratricopeptide (TPR) repeat protein
MPLEDELVGESSQIVALRDKIRRLLVFPPDAQRVPPLLLEGETGTGKGLLAHVIHRASPRRDGPFVDVNCAAIPETMLEAEMFGYERGAFTDARRAKQGLFQAAHHGTIFLDEVGLLTEALQAKLLKVLEERSVRRLGSTRNEPVDTWIIAATNEDLRKAIRERRFREDLYHRLAVVSVAVPPLRERERDVLILAEHFLARACTDYGLPRRTLAADAKTALLAYRWPGNVRELSNVIERAVLLSDAATLTAGMLGLPSETAPTTTAPSAETSAGARREPTRSAQEDSELEALLAALRETDGNVSRAAARLGLTRNTIRYRMEKYGLRAGATHDAPARPPARPAPDRPTAASDAPAAAAPPPALEWERRRVTFLRAAIDASDAGAAPRLIEEFVEKIRTFGGHVEEVSPTGLVAAFGLEPVEDAPRRAAHAAMAMQRLVARAGDGTIAPPVTIAIHVADTTMTRRGDLVEIDPEGRRDAAQVLDSLLAGTGDGIVVSPIAKPFLERRFELTPIGAGSTGSYRLVGADALRLRSTVRAARFVGRQHDLELLEGRLAAAMSGQGQVIGITGDAGIGKSRLLLEFRQRLDPDRVTCLEGQCVSYATETPYLPIRDLVRASCGIAEADTADVVAEKVSRTLADLDLAPAENTSSILHLLGAEPAEAPGESGPIAIKTRRIELVRQICVRMSRRTALVILVEDLHWVDRASGDCLAALGDAISGARVLLVATYRPGYRPPWIERSYATQIALQRLTREDSATIIEAISGPSPVAGDVVDTILAKADGNPFFLEELTRAVRDHGPGSATLHVPDTIEEVLRARVDRLTPEERHLLQSAAVIGKDVSPVLLRTVAGLPDDRFDTGIRRLQGAEFLYEVVGGAEPQYSFKHALTREVAYGLLPGHQRGPLHARILAAIETLAGGRLEEYVEQLAYHARSGEQWERAAGYLRRAGLRAFAHSANHEAVVWFEQALDAIAHLPDTETRLGEAVDLQFDLRNALTLLGEHERALAHLRNVQILARQLGDQRRLGRALAFEANSLFLLGQNGEAIEVGARARAVAEALGDVALRTTADMYVGRAHLHLGAFAEAIDIFAAIVAALTGPLQRDHLGSPALPSVFARAHLVEALSAVGRFAEAQRFLEESTALAETGNHPHTLFWAHRAVGLHHLERGEIEPAARALERAHALSRTRDMPTYVPRISSELGLAWALAGRVADALPMLTGAVAAARTRKQAATYAKALLLLGHVYVFAERFNEAADAAQQALELFRWQRERGNEASALKLLGDIDAARTPPDLAAAGEHYESARRLAAELGMRPLTARCHLGLGRVFRDRGDRARAVQAFQTAGAHFSEMGMRADLGVSEAELRAIV